jgi:hypothetical protein
MLLGYEYELLSKIAKYYRRHNNGTFRFSINDYKLKFSEEDPSLLYLSKLEQIGFVVRDNELLTLESHKWAEFFISKLEKELKNIDSGITCKYSKEASIIQFYDKDNLITEFYLNYDPKKSDEQKIIHFIHLDTFDFHLFWLDIINDTLLVEMLDSYLKKIIVRLDFDKRIRFNFFDGIESEYLNQIFHTSIKGYFSDAKMEVKDVSTPLNLEIKKFVKKDEFESFEVDIHGNQLIILKVDRRIEFLSLYNGQLFYSDAVIHEINKLKATLIEKVSNYIKISMFNKHKIIDNTKKSIQLVTLILVPLNALLLYLNTIGIATFEKITKNPWVIGVLGIILIIILIATLYLVVYPAYQLSRFKWDIKYKNS